MPIALPSKKTLTATELAKFLASVGFTLVELQCPGYRTLIASRGADFASIDVDFCTMPEARKHLALDVEALVLG